MNAFRLSNGALETTALRLELADPSCGGYAAFEGWVRDHNEGQRVTRLEYEAFAPLALREGERIMAEARTHFGLRAALCVHRVGALELGEIAVWVGVAAAHRDEAFRGCRYIIDEVKHRLPIWKKEHYANGDSGWVNCERCAAAPLHGDHQGETAPAPGHALLAAQHVHAKPR
jgi:molybdopterin synthase catalytic subunit